MIVEALALLAAAAADSTVRPPLIVDERACNHDGCEQFLPQGLTGEFAPTLALCAGPRLEISPAAMFYGDGRLVRFRTVKIEWKDRGHRGEDDEAQVALGGAATVIREGTEAPDDVMIGLALVYSLVENQLTILQANAPTEHFVRCP